MGFIIKSLGWTNAKNSSLIKYNLLVWAEVPKSCLETLDRLQRKAELLVGDESVSKTLDRLEHRRNVSCVCSVYVHVHPDQVFCTEICSLCKFFTRTTRPYHPSHPLILKLPAYRTTHYRGSSLCNHPPLAQSTSSGLFHHAWCCPF